MNISNSKKQLAKIISENGGWREVAEFAAQCIKGEIGFWHDKPTKSRGKDWCGSYLGTINDIKFSGERVGSWAQTTLSRDEYFHLYPAPDADGWIEWCGTERPLGVFAEIIDVRLYDGRVLTDFAGRFEWNTDGNARIVAYRLSKQEQAKSTAVGDDDTNLAAKEELEAMEYRPSIEQLAADYRNAKDYAERKQQEADEAKAEAEAKLAELVAAGKAVGLVLGVAIK